MAFNPEQMEIIAEPSNSEKLILIMRSQKRIQEEMTDSDHAVIAFLALNPNLIQKVEAMETYFDASTDLEAVLKICREEFINQYIDYYLQDNAADDFFSSEYKTFLVK
jgi:predicted RNase H-like nuclease